MTQCSLVGAYKSFRSTASISEHKAKGPTETLITKLHDERVEESWRRYNNWRTTKQTLKKSDSGDFCERIVPLSDLI
jgi:hypothetical protein